MLHPLLEPDHQNSISSFITFSGAKAHLGPGVQCRRFLPRACVQLKERIQPRGPQTRRQRAMPRLEAQQQEQEQEQKQKGRQGQERVLAARSVPQAAQLTPLRVLQQLPLPPGGLWARCQAHR